MAGSRYDVEKGGMTNGEEGRSTPPPVQQREGEREWVPWLVPAFVATNVAVFAVAMYVNNCPAHAARGGGKCVGAGFFRRFAFQPLTQNPLLGPSSAT